MRSENAMHLAAISSVGPLPRPGSPFINDCNGKTGDSHAILTQALASCIHHFGEPRLDGPPVHCRVWLPRSRWADFFNREGNNPSAHGPSLRINRASRATAGGAIPQQEHE